MKKLSKEAYYDLLILAKPTLLKKVDFIIKKLNEVDLNEHKIMDRLREVTSLREEIETLNNEIDKYKPIFNYDDIPF